jgi:hypothetical protein
VDPLSAADLAGLSAESRIALQPHIRPLDLQYPVDDVRLRVNAAGDDRATMRPLAMRRPKARYVAVHRANLSVFYKIISEAEFRILESIRNGRTLGDAIERAGAVSERDIETWFKTWAELGWLAPPLTS